MAISLDSLTSPTSRPIIATIVGEGGIGKTSLASCFAGPTIYIRTEDGTQSLAGRDDVALFEMAYTSQDVLDALNELGAKEHPFQTVVIDSITQLDTIIENEVVDSDPKAKSIIQAKGGYGAGFKEVARIHGQIRDLAGHLSVVKGMNIIFIAHADNESIDLPDQDPYTRYTIRMHRHSVKHYSDNVDLVAFIKLQTYTKGSGEKKKAITDGSRIITCYPTPNHISKNRFGITEDLVFKKDSNPFAQFIPALNDTAAKAA